MFRSTHDLLMSSKLNNKKSHYEASYNGKHLIKKKL